MTHDLKILPHFYKAVLEERKTFEVRKSDRPYAVGDFINLHEYDPNYAGKYTGRVWCGVITYVLNDIRYCKRDFVILGIKATNKILSLNCKVL